MSIGSRGNILLSKFPFKFLGSAVWKYQITCYTAVSTMQKCGICHQFNLKIFNGNWTKWSALGSEMIQVISQSNKPTAEVWFEIASMILDQNCITRGSVI